MTETNENAKKRSLPDPGRLIEALTNDLTALAGASEGETPTRLFTASQQTLRVEEKQLGVVQKATVKQREQQVKTRAEALIQSVTKEAATLKNRVETRKTETTAPLKGGFVVAGRVVDAETGVGLSDVHIRALDRDILKDDLLGETRTDDLGYYRLEYTRKDFRDLFEGKPEVYIEVLDNDGNTLYTSDQSFRHKAGKVEILDAAVDGSKLPGSLNRSARTEHLVQTRIEELEQQAKVIDQRLDARLGTAFKQGE